MENNGKMTLKIFTTRDKAHVIALGTAPFPPEMLFAALLDQNNPHAPTVEIIIEPAPEQILLDLEKHAATCENAKCSHHKLTGTEGGSKPPRPGKLPESDAPRARGDCPEVADIKGNTRGLLSLLSDALEQRGGR